MNFSDAHHICTSAHLGELIAFEGINNQHQPESWLLKTSKGRFYVKTHLKRYAPIFKTQITSLLSITNTNTLACPSVIAHGQTHKYAWLVLSFLDLYQTGNQSQLGIKLAALHRYTGKLFGWSETNFIGQGIQYNHQLDDWASFYRSQRLLPQLQRATEKGLPSSIVASIEKLLERIESFFTDYHPIASLLHGQLTMDNFAFLSDSNPVVLNPCCSYGDREMDLALTELSGEFSADFYTAYQAAYPLDKGYQQRKPIYQLYYLLNEFNQSGGDYAQQIKALLATIASTD
jgi:fructosamine-3-kinase